MDVPEGFEEIEAKVYRKGDQLLIAMADLAIILEMKKPEEEEDLGPPPAGFEWTGEVRPPKKGEYFWSEIKGQVVQAVKDETGVNQFGQPTGGRKILRPSGKPQKPQLRLVKDE